MRSHIGSERPEPGPYKCMLTLTSKTRFGVMRGCQEQNREGDLGGSLGFGWTGRPKANNILLVRWGVTTIILFNEMQHNFQVWKIYVSKSFSYKDSLCIIATQGNKGWWYLMINWLAYFREFSNLTRKVKERQQGFPCLEKIF